jgi:uncharacterized protein (DUF4415 family)
MSSAKTKRAPRPGRGYSQADWDAVSDNPPVTEQDFAAMRPAREVLSPEFLASVAKRRGRGPQKAPTKKLVSLRIDPDVLEKYRAEGPGWQARMNAVLRKGVGL